jgi:hypothetical protein
VRVTLYVVLLQTGFAVARSDKAKVLLHRVKIDIIRYVSNVQYLLVG